MPEPIVNLSGEFWKPIVGYEGIYEVSSMGRVKSLDRVDAAGARRKGALRKSGAHADGYRLIDLCKNKVRVTHALHRVVLEAHKGAPAEGQVCRHLNGDPTDNRACNLEWGTSEENCSDRDGHGTTIRGDQSPNAKLTEADVRAIRAAPGVRGVCRRLARQYGVSAQAIAYVRQRVTWSHIQ